jgi:S1-C subfamily serine protease
MNDEPTPSTPQGAGSPDPLDDTQRIDVPRYSPAPDPRPDARWAWASPGSGSQPPQDRWSQPAPAEAPLTPPGTAAWGAPATHAPATPPPAYNAPVQPATQKRRGGAGVGTVVTASLLSAVLAAGGTVAILDRAGALDRTVTTTQTGSTQQTGTQVPVTIDESSAVIDAAAKAGPAVVKITTTTSGDSGTFGTDIPSTGVGSGVIYDANGWILTNRHVVEGASNNTVQVELKDGREFPGRVYGIDSLTDLAIVKVDEPNLPVAPIGTSDGLKIGQLVVAIGSPLGMYSFSVTSGILSGKGRDIAVDSGQRITNLLQTDAAINPGNSGGPLVDATGAVVGINTAVATDSSGIGFAIPVDIAKPIMQQAVAGEALTRPWIGIRFESIDQKVKKAYSLTVDNGAYVSTGAGDGSAIVDGSPAAQAGLKDGDVILSINGIQIDQEHPLDALLVQFKPNDTVNLVILRDGTQMTLPVTLGTRPSNL